jgi:predicted transposase/invertase (TIGR01784 family)
MGIVVKAVLKSHEAKRTSDEEKSIIKWDLIKQCYRKGYTKNQIEMLLKFIDWVIRLPDAYQRELSIKIAKLEEEQKMNYVTSWERLAEQKGKRKGKQEGKHVGKQEEKFEIAQRMLKDNLSLESIAKYTGLSESEIKNLMKSSANSLSVSL